jgi:hypothetical protein
MRQVLILVISTCCARRGAISVIFTETGLKALFFAEARSLSRAFSFSNRWTARVSVLTIARV